MSETDPFVESEKQFGNPEILELNDLFTLNSENMSDEEFDEWVAAREIAHDSWLRSIVIAPDDLE